MTIPPARSVISSYGSNRLYCCFQRRWMAVKELPWCAAKDSPNHGRSTDGSKRHGTEERNLELKPIESFGIVAAMARTSRIIGVDNKLPWNLPEDRDHFKALTKGKVLIIGRNTFEEEPDRCHISHAARTIVVSTTADQRDLSHVSVVKSFPQALDLARQLVQESADEKNGIQCWVAGGERLYNEALLHKCAKELHLTIVQDDGHISLPDDVSRFARFPPKYRWDHRFKVASCRRYTSTRGDEGLEFEHYVYKRKGRQ